MTCARVVERDADDAILKYGLCLEHGNTMHDETKHKAGAKPDHLLDELTSIKDLLGGEHGPLDPADIPVLDDVVGLSSRQTTPRPPELLDIEQIFRDESFSDDDAAIGDLPFPFPSFTLDVALSDAPAPAAPSTPSRTQPREQLIRELVAEFLPRIEAELRERLARLDDAALRALTARD